MKRSDGTNGEAEGEEPDDPLRAYIITMRKGRHLSQERLADQIGMATRTYVAWERGTTKSLKSHYAQAMIRALGGAAEHLDQLPDLSADAARALATTWLITPAPEEAAREQPRRMIELADDDPVQLEELIAELRRQARSDPTLLSWLAGYLARGASRPPS